MQSGTGDRASAEARFEEIYERWYADVWAYSRRRVGHDCVDDVVADTFMTAWRRIDDVPDGAAARLWLYRVAYRVVGHVWRGRSRGRRLDDKLQTASVPPMSSPEQIAVVNDELHRVLEAAQQLKDDDAEILRLVSWERLSPAEIAEILDLRPNAVNKRVSRARASLTMQFERLERRASVRIPAARQGGAT